MSVDIASEETYYVVLFISSVIVTVLSFLLLGINIPKDESWLKLRNARKYLSLAYLILAICGFIEIYFDNSDDTLFFVIATLFVAAFQALLYTSAFLVMMQAEFVKFWRVLIHSGITILAGGTLTLGYIYLDESFSLAIVLTSVVFYAMQQFYYVRLFRKYFNICVKQLEDFYDEEQKMRLRWVQFGYYTQLLIGVLALIAAFGNFIISDVFIFTYTSYCIYMAVRFINYRLWASAMVAANSSRQASTETVTVENLPLMTEKAVLGSKEDDERFAVRLQKWVAEKGYTEKDLSVDEFTDKLGVDRNYMRYYFRTYVHTDFRTWRVELRVNEAKRIMKENPRLTLTQVGEMVGFNHRSNFFNQFQRITGCTIAAYREQLTKSE